MRLVTIINPDHPSRTIYNPGTSFKHSAQWVADDYETALLNGADPATLIRYQVVRLPRRMGRNHYPRNNF